LQQNYSDARLFCEPLPEGIGHRLRFGMHLQLVINTLHVEVDGAEADAQYSRRALIVVAHHQQTEQVAIDAASNGIPPFQRGRMSRNRLTTPTVVAIQ
jgi:hypothetical protein